MWGRFLGKFTVITAPIYDCRAVYKIHHNEEQRPPPNNFGRQCDLPSFNDRTTTNFYLDTLFKCFLERAFALKLKINQVRKHRKVIFVHLQRDGLSH